MASQAHDEPITGSLVTASPWILNQKKNTENQKLNPSRRWRLAESHHVASSLAERSNPNTKAKQTPTNQTQRCSSKPNTEVFIKKKKEKKILNTQTKTKPSNPRSRRRCRRHRRSSLVVVVVACSVAPHHRS